MTISKKSKVFATSITAAVAATAVVPSAFAASFPDVPADHPAAQQVSDLVDAGVVVGFPDGSFKPGDSITREDAARMVSAILELDAVNAQTADFPDVNQDAWYAKYVNALVENDLIDGLPDGTFGVDETLTRAQFAKIVVDAYGLEMKSVDHPFTDLKEDAWYNKYIETLYANDLIKGTTPTTFSPNDEIKRVDFALLLANADYKYGTLLNSLHEAVVNVESVKAIDSTTMEATFSGELTDQEIAELTFEFDPALEVTNVERKADSEVQTAAAGDATTTVVLTTEEQVAGTEYKLVSVNGDELETSVEVAPVPAPEVESVSAIDDITVTEGDDVTLPEMVEVTYSDDTTEEVAVTWNSDEFDFSEAGTYELTGTIEGSDLTASVTVVVEAAVVTLEVESVSAINTQGQELSLDAVTVTSTLEVNFGEKVTEESININNIRLFEADGDVPVSITANNVSLSKDGETALVDLDGSLDKDVEYKLVVNNVENADGEVFAESVTNFTTSTDAVVDDVTFDTGFINPNPLNANSNVDVVTVEFDEALDSTSVNVTNVAIYDAETGNRVAAQVRLNASDATEIEIDPTNDLPDGQYFVTINNVNTLTGTDAEDYTFNFTVNADAPLSAAYSAETLDGTSLPGTVWPKLTAGVHEADGNEYYAGLQLQVDVAEKLDADSVQDYVRVVETDTEEVVDATISYNAASGIITIVPNADLKEGTDYEIQFLGGLKTDLGILLDPSDVDDVDQTISFDTLDITSPTVVSATSEDGLTSLSVDEAHDFTFEFSEALALDETNIAIVKTSVDLDDTSSPAAGDILTPVTDYSVSPVLGSDNEYTLRIAKDKLERNEAYKIVVVGQDLEDQEIVTQTGRVVLNDGTLAGSNGNELEKSYVLSLTTVGEDVTVPKVVNVYNSSTINADFLVDGMLTNVVNGDTFVFEFNEEIQNIDSTKFDLQVKSGTRWVTPTNGESISVGSLVTSQGGVDKGVDVTVNSPLEDATYRVVLEEGAVDDTAATPNESSEYASFEFVGSEGDDNANDVEVLMGSDDGTTLTTGTATDDSFYITFEEEQIFEVLPESVTVTDADGNEVVGELEEIDDQITGIGAGFAGDDKAYKFTPEERLSNSTVYTVTVDGVKDTAGNTIAKKVV
ncbi:hypothetical protein JCM21714_1445 [Gracilibacillus boraciitolerans JCM 21714]|uniref:SLH domain-containing protein n=1 Tax=Gracilibacillus boraciitolerans JCM 21714 TaxID=1298598 RepID=W4VI18_9BACI|nr:S-layer homology domain-containing protein [Gracilibacillus boraciitolerans]GAE92443.1 hypothetical protein JCM21714_1445 [Gracilibacillus boraciitolerans JCM 21714]